MPLRFRIKVDAPPEQAFAYVADVARHGEWANPSAKLQVDRVSQGPPAVGSRYRSNAKFLGKPITADIEVTACEPSSRLGFVAVQHTKKGDDPFVHEFTFRAADGGTIVERSFDRPQAPAQAKVTGLLLYPAIRADAMKGLKNLKARLEQRG